MEHQLQKLGSKSWRCTICQWLWLGKPRSECPGLPCYLIGNKPIHLQSSLALRKKNLTPTGEVVAYGIHEPSNLNKRTPLYDSRASKVDNPSLPHIYTWDDRPCDLHTPNKLYKWNLKPGNAVPAGCVWDRTGWTFLYRKEDCKDSDPSLPPCYDYSDLPLGLKTKRQLEKEQYSTEGVTPCCCYRFWDKEEGWVTVLLYHPDDAVWNPRDHYITKTTLKRTYLLSDGWIKRLGEPEVITENPHHHKFADMQLYSKQRVEAFLADNAEEYATWLDERDRYVLIFELNREAIEAGRAAANKNRQTEKQAKKDQTALCLRCASGCAMPKGFLCAIHPMGLDLHQIPCPDWTAR